ncbi:hypothetical protein GCM10025870_28880 [Agromyces marinus]|uniref:Glycosyltransferase RgtA/B/C/D-like domain-containing protein n=1 Tax=Agromyces marinus TaxID=1389020 RepID=A0ABM8H4S8_9MICO|nr:hypothetical protein GCM10025870_28880 [Agromyces marinus]
MVQEVAAGSAPTREPVGSRVDTWWSGLMSTPRRRALWTWGGPIAVTLLAAVLRFWNLGHPQALVFDETYYVKDAWTLLANGYESTWPEGANEDFARGDPDVFSDDPSYVVHPPLGKWMIGLGMALFGADSAFWWRASTALAGTIAVFVLTMTGRLLFRSTLVAVIAGFLFAIEGNAIVMSRVALLDTWLMLFCLLGFWFVLLDRADAESRLRERLGALRDAGADPHWGPVVWLRPWVIAAGVAFGAAIAVKWSGLYFLAAFGVYLVLVDAMARRRAGLPFWLSGALLKQGPVTFALLVPVAFVVYLSSWTGWLTTDGGYYRHWADDAGNAATGFWSWVPHSLQSLWHYHQAAYGYHVGVSSPHPWQANPSAGRSRCARRTCTSPRPRTAREDAGRPSAGRRSWASRTRSSGGRPRSRRSTSCTASRGTASGRRASSSSAWPPGTCRGCSTSAARCSSSTRSPTSRTCCSRSPRSSDSCWADLPTPAGNASRASRRSACSSAWRRSSRRSSCRSGSGCR